MSTYNFESVVVPAGAFIGWASEPGQVITGIVTLFEEKGGTNYEGEPCPLLELRLTEPCYSVNKRGERTDFQAGETVSITAGQANLKRNLRAAYPDRGDVIRIRMASIERTANGDAKVFQTEIARGAGLDRLNQFQPVHVPGAPQSPQQQYAPQAPQPPQQYAPQPPVAAPQQPAYQPPAAQPPLTAQAPF